MRDRAFSCMGTIFFWQRVRQYQSTPLKSNASAIVQPVADVRGTAASLTDGCRHWLNFAHKVVGRNNHLR